MGSSSLMLRHVLMSMYLPRGASPACAPPSARAIVGMDDVRVAVHAVAAARERVVVAALVRARRVADNVVQDDHLRSARLRLDELLLLLVVHALDELRIVEALRREFRRPLGEREALLAERDAAVAQRGPRVAHD